MNIKNIWWWRSILRIGKVTVSLWKLLAMLKLRVIGIVGKYFWSCWKTVLVDFRSWVQVLRAYIKGCKRPGVAAYVCSPSTVEPETRGSLEFTIQPLLWTPGPRERFDLKNKLESYWTIEEDTINLWPPHRSVHTSMCAKNTYSKRITLKLTNGKRFMRPPPPQCGPE